MKIEFDKTIKSCLAQDFRNFELIIVNDCSTDDTLEVIKSWAARDNRIRFVSNDVNKKLPGSLNSGFAIAKGKYYTWISDDNLFLENALSFMYLYLEANQAVDLVYTDYQTINDEGKLVTRIYQETPEYLPIRDCVGACFLYRASLAEKVGGYNENLSLIEDYEYWLRCGLVGKLAHLPIAPYYYRVHSGSLTKTQAKEIKALKMKLKEIFRDKYIIPKELKGINLLYLWFLSDRSLLSYIKLFSIILMHPVSTIKYIMLNIRRL
jgi:glycosyltransferase involved in cell wall biosynthesis